MRCKDTKNAMKSIMCQIKCAQAIPIFMYLRGKCKSYLLSSNSFSKQQIVDIQFYYTAYTSLAKRDVPYWSCNANSTK